MRLSRNVTLQEANADASQPREHASGAARQAAYRKRCDRARKLILASKGLPQLPAISTILPVLAALECFTEYGARTGRAYRRRDARVFLDERSEEWQEGEKAADFFQERIDEVQAMMDAMSELSF